MVAFPRPAWFAEAVAREELSVMIAQVPDDPAQRSAFYQQNGFRMKETAKAAGLPDPVPGDSVLDVLRAELSDLQDEKAAIHRQYTDSGSLPEDVGKRYAEVLSQVDALTAEAQRLEAAGG